MRNLMASSEAEGSLRVMTSHWAMAAVLSIFCSSLRPAPRPRCDEAVEIRNISRTLSWGKDGDFRK